MTLRHRILPLVALALAASTALIGPAGPAAAAEDPTASVSEVTCVETDGEVTVTLAASDTDPATFLVLVDGVGGEEIAVAAGATETVVTSGLEDGDHTFEATLAPEGEEEFGEPLAFEERAVACDPAPEGPYKNVRGDVLDSCEGQGWVTASNKAIGGNLEDLEPVTFVVTFTPTDDPEIVGGGDGEDPVEGGDGADGGVIVERSAAGPPFDLDTFVLDATTQTYDRTFSAEDLGGTGDLTLSADGEVVATAHIGLCIVLAVENGAGGGPEVVNTGA